MTEPTFDRRALLGGAALASAAIATSPHAQVALSNPPSAFAPAPLPFDPRAIPGLSEKLLTSHHDNNYVGAVKRLGAIRAAFSALDLTKASVFEINGLKREELIAWNSMILHDIYFNSLGVADRPGAPLSAAIERDFGSHDRWASEFSSLGKALGGGSGWVVLTYSRRDGRLVNTWAADHTMTLADGAPLLALDMYEHAYHMDFGAKAPAYVDAFMKTVNWRRASEAFRRAAA